MDESQLGGFSDWFKMINGVHQGLFCAHFYSYFMSVIFPAGYKTVWQCSQMMPRCGRKIAEDNDNSLLQADLHNLEVWS